MNPDLIKAKLESLARFLERIRTKLPDGKEQFVDDWDAQDVVMKNLERAVQVCVDVANHILADDPTPPPSSMAMAFVFLARKGVVAGELADRMAKAIGLRNLAVHEYESLDYGRIFETLSSGLGVFDDYGRAVLRFLE